MPITGTIWWLNQLRLDLNLDIIDNWRPWYKQGAAGRLTETQVGGNVIEYNGLTFVSVRGAGHMVPQWAPISAYAMITNFLLGEPLPNA